MKSLTLLSIIFSLTVITFSVRSTNAAAIIQQSNKASSRCKKAFHPFSWQTQQAICLIILEQTKPISSATTTIIKDVTKMGTSTVFTTTTTTPISTLSTTTTTIPITSTIFYDVRDIKRRIPIQIPPSLRQFELHVLRSVCLEIFYGQFPQTLTQSNVITTTTTSTISTATTTTATVTTKASPSITTTTITTSPVSTVQALSPDSTVYCGTSSGCTCTIAGPAITCTYTFVGQPQSFKAPCSGSLAANIVGGQGGQGDLTGAIIKSPLVQVPSTPAQTRFTTGDAFIILVGGNGQYYSRRPPALGGYNGGGNSTFAGAGGGSTEIDFNGMRLLVASGSGGGGGDSTASHLPDVDYECGTSTSGCNIDDIAGAGGGGAPGGAASIGYQGPGWAGIPFYNMGDSMQFLPSSTGPASGATLIYTCSA